MLEEKRKILREAHKPIRKEASSLVDLKPLNEAFRKSLNEAVQVKNHAENLKIYLSITSEPDPDS